MNRTVWSSQFLWKALTMQMCVIFLVITFIPIIMSFSSYRPPAQYPNEDLNGASAYGSGCGCGYGSGQSSPDTDYIVLTSLVLGAVGWLAVAAAVFAAFLTSQSS